MRVESHFRHGNYDVLIGDLNKKTILIEMILIKRQLK